jgi:hypothetical protein
MGGIAVADAAAAAVVKAQIAGEAAVAVDAGGRRVTRRDALIPTRPTVGGIRRRVEFAASVWVAVAISPPGITRPQRAGAALAAGTGVGEAAARPTRSTMVRVGLKVNAGAATRVRGGQRTATRARLADPTPGAGRVARPAVVSIDLQVDAGAGTWSQLAIAGDHALPVLAA